MKSWLAGILRVLADFFIFLAFFALLSAFSASLERSSLAGFPLLFLRSLDRYLPFALLCGLAFAAPSWRRDKVAPLAAWGGSLLVILLVLAGSLLYRRLDFPEPASSRSAAAPRATFIESGNRAAAVGRWDGELAADVVLADFPEEGEPRLTWLAETALSEGAIVHEGRDYALGHGHSLPPSAARRLIAPAEDLVHERRTRLDALPFPRALLGYLGFSLLLAGALLPALRVRWPLACVITALVLVSAAAAIDIGLSAPGVRAVLATLVRSPEFDTELLAVAVEGALGMVLTALALVFPAKEPV